MPLKLRILTRFSLRDILTYFGRAPRLSAFLDSLRDFDDVLRQKKIKDLLGSLHVLFEEEFRQPASQARLSIAHGGSGFPSTTALAPIAFLG